MNTPKKSYSFYFNANDWLASPSVREMSKAERGVFICLLALAWGLENKLPASPDKLRRMAEMSTAEWAESGEIILEQFRLSDCGTYRFNKRLQVEVVKEQKKSLSQAAKAEKRWGTPGDAAASKNDAAASKKASPGDAQVQEQVQGTTDVVPREAAAVEPSPLKAKKTQAELVAERAAANDAEMFTADNWPGVNSPQTFKAICADLRLPIDLDHEAYRAAIQDKMRSKGITGPAGTLRSWISTFFLNERQARGLLTMTAGLPTVPTPDHLLPAKGQEQPGQVIAIKGVPGDTSMNRMKVAAAQTTWPTAQIHAILPRP